MRFRTDPPEGLTMVPLDAMTAIYHRRSGMTHLVAEPVPEILAELASGDASLAELAERLDVAGADAVLAERLSELCAIGLVATV